MKSILSHGGKANIKKIASIKMILTAAVFIISFGLNYAFAQVVITVPTLPTITGCSFPTAYSTLGNIVITETAINDISTAGTLVLSAPANFEFLSSTGTITFTAGKDITSISSVTIGASSITFTINLTTFSNLDAITISGIKVRGITGAAGPQNVTRTAGTSVVAGNANGAIHATFTSFLNSVTGGTIATALQIICNGGDPTAFTQSVASTGSGALTYQWKESTDGFTADVATTATYDVPSGLTATTSYRRVTTSTLNGVACTANSNDVQVMVQNVVTGGTIAASQTICSGGDPVAFTQSVASSGSGALTYQWKQSTDGYSATLATTTTYDVPSGLTATTTYRRITISTLGGVACAGVSNDITVTVNSVTGGTIAAAQTICNGGDPAAFTESIAATGSGALTYDWRYSTDGYSTSLASTATYNVPSGLTATTTYRRITTSTLGGVACTANSNDIVVTVQSIVTGGVIAADQTICSGGDPVAFTESVAASGSGTLTYQWKQSTDGYIATIATTPTYDAPSGLTATTTYRRITTSTIGGVACSANSNDIIITVNAVTGGTIAADQTICNGGDPVAFTESIAATGSGTLSYQWKESTDGYTADVATTVTYDVPSGLTATTTYRRITTSSLGGVTCTANSNDIVVTVQSVVTGGTIAAAQTICSGGDPVAFTESVAASGSGTLSYQWKQSTDAYSATLATTNTYDVPSGLTATTTYRRITTSTLNGVACTSNSNDIIVTAQSIVSGGTIASSQTICSGGDPAAFTESVAATGSGTLSYQWKESTDGYTATLATTTTYDVPSGLTATTTYRRITTSSLGGVTCTANSNDITVTVNAVTAGAIAVDQTICNGGDPAAFTESIAATGSGALTYDWKYSTDSYGSSLSSTATYDVPTGLTATTTYRRITTSTLGGVTCSSNSNDILVTVQNIVSAGTISSSQTICSGGDPVAFTESVAATGSGTLTYQWKQSTDGYSATLATTPTYDVPSGLTTTTTYRRITTSTLNGVSCIAYSNDIIVSVNDVTAGTIAAAQTICNGGDPVAFTESVASTASGTLTYQWKQSTDGYSATLATTATYDVPAGLTVTTTYRRITTSTLGGVSCTSNSNDILVTVQNVATAGTIASSQTICSGGDPAAFTETVPATGSGTLSYQWKQSTDGYSATLATTTTYDVPSGLTATTTYRRITTSTLGGVSCVVNSNDIIVTVNAVTSGSIAAAQTICSGGDPVAFTESTTSTGSGTLTYQWKQSTDGYSATIATTATYDVPSGLTATTTYRRITISTLGGLACTVTSNDITITVNDVTAGTIASAQTICIGEDPVAFTESVPSTGSGILNYQWKQSTDGYSATLTTSPTYDVPAGLTATTTYRRLTNSILGGVSCIANSNDITVTVNPLPPDPDFTPYSTTVCSGTPNVSFTLDSFQNNVSYSWSATNATLATAWGGGTNAIFNFGTISPAVITLQVTNTVTGCTTSHSESIIVSGNQALPPPPISIINDNWLICQLNGSGITYQWGYDSLPALISVVIPEAVFQQFHAIDYPDSSRAYWVIVSEGDCFTKSYLDEQFLGIDKQLENQFINLFPNPAKESLNISCSEKIGSFQVFEISGRLVIEKQIISPERLLTIDIKKLNNGIYLMEFETIEHTKKFKRFIVQN